MATTYIELDPHVILKRVADAKAEYARVLREYSQSHSLRWMQLPYVALLNQGRNGWGDNSTYRYGHYILRHTAEHGFTPFGVDCANGDILYFGKPATDDQIIKLDVRDLNGTRILKEYMEETERYRDCEDLSIKQGYAPDWRSEMAKELRLEPFFKRTKANAIPKPKFGYGD